MPPSDATPRPRPVFHFEINSFAEFAAFVALIRGEDLDDQQLARMAARLQTATDAQAAAVADAATP